jgi:hypothetical protein
LNAAIVFGLLLLERTEEAIIQGARGSPIGHRRGPHRFWAVSNIGLFTRNATHHEQHRESRDQAMNLRCADKPLNLNAMANVIRHLRKSSQIGIFAHGNA